MRKLMEVSPRGHHSLTIWLVCIAGWPGRKAGWFIGLINKGVPDFEHGTTLDFYEPDYIDELAYAVGKMVTKRFSAIDEDRIRINKGGYHV